jgi:hypothetical protein
MTDRISIDQAVADAEHLLEQAQGLITQAQRSLQACRARSDQAPYMDVKTAARVEKLGEVASRHKAFIDTHGLMTRADSLAIRRQMYGSRVQSTANLFGTIESGALFYRDRPYGTPVRDDDPIRLTDEGTRIAELWRATHQAPASGRQS